MQMSRGERGKQRKWFKTRPFNIVVTSEDVFNLQLPFSTVEVYGNCGATFKNRENWLSRVTGLPSG